MINRFSMLIVLPFTLWHPVSIEAQMSRPWILWERHGDPDIITRTWRLADAFPTYQVCREGLRVAMDAVIARNPRYGRDPLGMKDVVMRRADDGTFLAGTEVFRICLPDTISDPRDLIEPARHSLEPWVLWRKSVFGPPPVESWTISVAVPDYETCEQRFKESFKDAIQSDGLGAQRGPVGGSRTLQYLCLPSRLDPRGYQDPVGR